MEALTQKETSLLTDAKNSEAVCIEKYNKYASQASDPNLRTMFQGLSQKEQQHLNTINSMLSGTVPPMQQSQQQAQQQPPQIPANQNNVDKTNDSYLCKDALSSEKHVSATYNTAIFEFKDTNIRQALNHIQKEEQEHGEQIYNYMTQNGMYN